MKQKIKSTIKKVLITSLFLPILAFAAVTPTIKGLIEIVGDIFMTIIPVIGIGSFSYVMYNGYKYIQAAGSGKQQEAKDGIIYGIVGLFVMVSVWGLVNVIRNTFDIEADSFNAQDIPQLTVPSE